VRRDDGRCRRRPARACRLWSGSAACAWCTTRAWLSGACRSATWSRGSCASLAAAPCRRWTFRDHFRAGDDRVIELDGCEAFAGHRGRCAKKHEGNADHSILRARSMGGEGPAVQ